MKVNITGERLVEYFAINTEEARKLLSTGNTWHAFDGNYKNKYIIFLSSDYAEYTNDINKIKNKKELLIENDNIFVEMSEEEVKKREESFKKFQISKQIEKEKKNEILREHVKELVQQLNKLKKVK